MGASLCYHNVWSHHCLTAKTSVPLMALICKKVHKTMQNNAKVVSNYVAVLIIKTYFFFM